jgi:hypothetical protein
MALIGNYSVIQKSPATFTSGLSIAQVRSNYDKSGAIKNSYTHFGLLASYPSGYAAPYSWSMARQVGAMSSFTSALESITTTGSMAGGRNLEAPMSASLTVTNAQLDQIVTFIASALLNMTGTAELQAAVQMQASAVLQLTTNANIQAIIDVLASSNVTITPNAILTALAFMNAEAGGPTPLSPEGLANAVWDKSLADHQNIGSTGRALSDAGGAGNPWSADLASNNTAGTFGALVQKLLTVAKFLGLK